LASSTLTSNDTSSTSTSSPSTLTPLSQKHSEHVVEVVSDAGEGAQKCGQTFGTVSAQMGNGAWTVEIIPSEIRPPARTPASASGVRIRIGSNAVTNWGDKAQLCVALNEQVLLARHRAHSMADDCVILLENMWATHDDEDIRAKWKAAREELREKPYRIVEVPMEEECLTVVDDARRGKNMFALGMLTWIYNRDPERMVRAIDKMFGSKGKEVVDENVALLERGSQWASQHLDFRVQIPTHAPSEELVVMNGNTAMGMGAIAAGLEMCAMYPITPASSVSHYLADVFERAGGVVHQAEDEIAAMGVALGASYAGKVAFTVTSGPGLALKTELIGLAVMTETPIVICDIQRGGPSTGLPTKVEQSDLLACLYGEPGDAPKVVMAPSTIEECFHAMVTARQVAESLRCVVMVLSDANLATGVQAFPRPQPREGWVQSSPDQSALPPGARPFDWDEHGLSRRSIPGQAGGEYTATGLAHDERGHVSYDPHDNQRSHAARSRKLAAFQETMRAPVPYGDDEGDLLLITWGSTRGAVEEAVDRARAAGHKVSTAHLTFLSPLEPGLKALFSRFKKVMTIEINYSDDKDAPGVTEENRRRGQLCFLLRGQLLIDVDCWTRVLGQPLGPNDVLEVIERELADMNVEASA
jgi:2-oxoglutarate ferredoxin oxidoreductase subunit alpha